MKLNEERASYITCDAAARGASSFSFFLFICLFVLGVCLDCGRTLGIRQEAKCGRDRERSSSRDSSSGRP